MSASEKVAFEGLIPSDGYGYLSNYQGYGGFDWTNMGLFGKAYLTNHDEQDTGYYSALHGHTVAYTMNSGTGNYGYGSYGTFEAANGRTFSLESGVFASAYLSGEAFYVESLTAGGQTIARVKFFLGTTAKVIHFANYGHGFQDIAAIRIGAYTYAYSPGGAYRIAIDNLKIRWDGGMPHSRGPFARPHGPAGHHVHAGGAHELLAAPHSTHHDGPAPGGAYHSEMLSLDSIWGHSRGELTDEFTLPRIEHHFGT